MEYTFVLDRAITSAILIIGIQDYSSTFGMSLITSVTTTDHYLLVPCTAQTVDSKNQRGGGEKRSAPFTFFLRHSFFNQRPRRRKKGKNDR